RPVNTRQTAHEPLAYDDCARLRLRPQRRNPWFNERMTLPSPTLLAQAILSGVFDGALYGLLGLGLSLSWGLLRQINLAHFALAFLGAYLTYQLATAAAMDPLATLLITAPLFFVLGAAIHWLLSRFAVTPLNSLLVTFGLTVIVESVIQWFWTADYRRL